VRPPVSVIIVNYRGESLIGDCLRALECQTYKDFETIIIDNASPDRSLAEIRRFLEGSPMAVRTKVIALERNHGFAGANLEGLTHAGGKYIALLNNDTEPDPAWLTELCKAMDEDPETGICASKLISRHTGAIDSAGDGYTKALRGFKEGEGEPPDRFNEKRSVFGACAGAALYRMAMLDEIGFFDDDFFLIHEDTDLNFRAKLAGWKTVYVPGAVVLHRVTSSIGYMSDVQVYHTLRNAEFVRMKNMPLPVLARCLPGFVFGFISEFAFFAIRHRRAMLFFKAKKDALKALPRMLVKRNRIMKDRKIGNKALLKEMTPVWNVRFLTAKLRKLLHG
jgi:GT2 family glycosyltransferase